MTTKYYLDGDKVLYESNGTTELNYYYDNDGTLIGFSYNNNDYYFYTRNNFGDIIEIRDKNGNIKVTYEYDAWGKIISKVDNSGIGLADKNPYLYRGYRYDNETNLYYLNSRYYNPEIGRFINADDVSILDLSHGELLGANLYAYGLNNPVMNVDQLDYGQ